jgi:predicted acyl esterase
MSLTAYDKDIGPSRYISTGRGDAFRGVGLNLGDLTVSNVAAFEGADPGFWVPNGYAVVIVDAPGTGDSPGIEDPFGKGTVDAFKQAVEWVARGGTYKGPAWSNGKVATQGTSYLGIIQWLVASQQPEGLNAINVWQGSSDLIRDDIYNGGIQETAFIPFWLAGKSTVFQDPDTKPTFGMSFNKLPYELVKGLTHHTIPRVIDVEKIQVPSLIAATWSTQGLHSRGSFEGYRRFDVENTGRVPRYLYTHGREEWSVSTSTEAMEVELEFFDCYLKEDKSACKALEEHPVRIEVMHGDNKYHDRVSKQ